MQNIGFPKPRMREEKRIALLPEDIKKNIENPSTLWFEKGYSNGYEGFSDEDYINARAKLVDTEQAYGLEVLCQPKFSLNDLKHMIKQNQIVFGWLHLTKKERLTQELKKRKATAIAWELMTKDGEKLFKKNSLLTGEFGVLNSIGYVGKIPEECNVALIGKGCVGKGAINQLEKLGVEKIRIYDSKNSYLLKDELANYDVIINSACTDKKILDTEDLKKMKRGALLIDIGGSCIWGGYRARSIYSPFVHINEGKNLVYCVNHVPTLVYQTATKYNSAEITPYINLLSKGEMDETLQKAIVIEKGKPIKERLRD